MSFGGRSELISRPAVGSVQMIAISRITIRTGAPEKILLSLSDEALCAVWYLTLMDYLLDSSKLRTL